MATFKITWFFEGVQAGGQYSNANVGWTESWYLTSADIDTALQTASSVAAGTYLGFRILCMPQLYRCVWVRASNVQTPKLSKTSAPRNAVGTLPPETTNSNAAQVTCALLVDFTVLPTEEQPVLHHRRFLIRGLSRHMIDGNLIDRGGAPWDNMVNFLNFLGKRPTGTPIPAPNPQGPYMIKFNSDGAVKAAITGLTLAEDGHTFGLIAALGAVARDKKIILTGVKFPLNLNRFWTNIYTAAAPPYTLGRSRKQLSGEWDVSKGGFAAVDTPVFRNPDQYLVIGLRLKKVGKPFRLTRGRR